MTYLFGIGLVALGIVALFLCLCIIAALSYKFIACLAGLGALLLVFAPLAAGTAIQHHPVPHWVRLGLAISLSVAVIGFLFSAIDA